MSLRLDIRVTRELYEKVRQVADENNITVTDIIRTFVLECAKKNELPFSITAIHTFKDVSSTRVNTRFDSFQDELMKFKEICKRNYIPTMTAVKTYLYLCCEKNEILIKPDKKI